MKDVHKGESVLRSVYSFAQHDIVTFFIMNGVTNFSWSLSQNEVNFLC